MKSREKKCRASLLNCRLIPSLRVLKEGGYEGGGSMVYYGLPSPWAPSIEDRIMTTVNEMLK